jgi:hypothetical protein
MAPARGRGRVPLPSAGRVNASAWGAGARVPLELVVAVELGERLVRLGALLRHRQHALVRSDGARAVGRAGLGGAVGQHEQALDVVGREARGDLERVDGAVRLVEARPAQVAEVTPQAHALLAALLVVAVGPFLADVGEQLAVQVGERLPRLVGAQHVLERDLRGAQARVVVERGPQEADRLLALVELLEAEERGGVGVLGADRRVRLGGDELVEERAALLPLLLRHELAHALVDEQVIVRRDRERLAVGGEGVGRAAQLLGQEVADLDQERGALGALRLARQAAQEVEHRDRVAAHEIEQRGEGRAVVRLEGERLAQAARGQRRLAAARGGDAGAVVEVDPLGDGQLERQLVRLGGQEPLERRAGVRPERQGARTAPPRGAGARAGDVPAERRRRRARTATSARRSSPSTPSAWARRDARSSATSRPGSGSMRASSSSTPTTSPCSSSCQRSSARRTAAATRSPSASSASR